MYMGYMSLPSSELRYSTGQKRQLSSKVPIDKEYDSSQEGVLEYLCFDILYLFWNIAPYVLAIDFTWRIIPGSKW